MTETHQPGNHKRPYLTGTHATKLDAKRRIKIPKPFMDSLLAINGAQRTLYLMKPINKDKILCYPLPTIDKIRKELGEWSLLDYDKLHHMEELGSSLHESTIANDDRIIIPNDMLNSLDIKPGSNVLIKGAFEFITISKA